MTSPTIVAPSSHTAALASPTSSSQSRPASPTHSNNLEPGRLYAVLSYRGDLASWTWAFFVPDPAGSPIGSRGTIFRVVSHAERDLSCGEDTGLGIAVACVPSLDAAVGGGWSFDMSTTDITGSPITVAIVSLGDLESLGPYEDVIGGDGLEPMFRTVPIPESGTGGAALVNRHGVTFSSRTWFLDAICVLHDCGVVTCDDVWMLERELRRFAFSAMDGYLQNKGWTSFTAERCS
ncbi:hypothetical protein HGRIS_014312 [Hohenbuehelia grisea]|uniref:Uncharacterized protein n=1 Tax=Hohenbuehelia grisea TaxID=104357 RepID=A0ABR3JSZ4_9AGAR